MASNYLLRATAGPSYDPATHSVVGVNSPTPTPVRSPLISASVRVRIRDFRGLPTDSPATDPRYFAADGAHAADRYSISLAFTLARPGEAQAGCAREAACEGDGDGDGDGDGVRGADLLFGNDLDRPVRDRLPPGFGAAMRVMRWWVDPGLEGDAYADRPHLYGPALSSMNVVRVGGGEAEVLEEGAEEEAGRKEREEAGMPADAKERMKWGLRKEARDRWLWRFGREYAMDFFNPYLDFSEFALRLPGFNLPILRWWDGQGLRYVLRNRYGQVYLVILFTLIRKEDVEEDGSIKPEALEAAYKGTGAPAPDAAADEESGEEAFDEEKAVEHAKRKLSGVEGMGVDVKTGQDDVD